MPKLVIFDCDGVLVDSEAGHNKLFIDLLKEYNHHMSEEEGLRLFTGMIPQEARRYVKDQFGIEITDEHWKEHLNPEIFLPLLASDLKPLMHSTLQYLHDKKIQKCVGSNGILEMIHYKLRHTDQKQFFEDAHIFSVDHVKNPKPAPDLFLFAAKQMGYQPEDCLVVEDSAVGIAAAKAAGIPVIGFLGGSHTKDQSYVNKIKGFNVPIAHSAEEVLGHILSH